MYKRIVVLGRHGKTGLFLTTEDLTGLPEQKLEPGPKPAPDILQQSWKRNQEEEKIDLEMQLHDLDCITAKASSQARLLLW